MVKPGNYPYKKEHETINKKEISIGKTSLLLVEYINEKTVNIYIGGPQKWCIHCEIIKDNDLFKSIGYLIKVRYDLLCSLTHNFAKGKDTKQIVNILIQYIYNNYGDVKELYFNDLSTKRCDNNYDINLAVMTYLYTNKTWYEKNFDAYLSPQSKDSMKKYINKYNEAKKLNWDTIKYTIDSTYPDIEKLYNEKTSWKDFFETIYNNLEIADFCNFISTWIDSFILKYFNNLQGLTYVMPIQDRNLKYTESIYLHSGGKFTRKNTRKLNIDYK